MPSGTRGQRSSDRVESSPSTSRVAHHRGRSMSSRIGRFHALSGLDSSAKRMKSASAPNRMPVDANERQEAGSQLTSEPARSIPSPPLGGLPDRPPAATLGSE